MTSRGCCSAPTTHAGGLVMAIAAGVARTKRGVRHPSVSALRKLRDALDVPDGEFLRWVELLADRSNGDAA